MSVDPLLCVEGLSVSYPDPSAPGRRRQVVRAVSFTIPPGESAGLVGESGSGKTTVARTLVGLTQADAGQALLQGTDLLKLSQRDWPTHRKRVQMVFQDPLASLNPARRIWEILREPFDLHFADLSRRERDARILRLLDEVHLTQDLLSRFPHELSGGQRQRVGIARALAVEPDLLICDEPVSALDVSVQARLLNLFRELHQKRGLTLLTIAHDLAVVEFLCDHVIVMQEGQIVEDASSEAIYRSPQHPYTQELLASVPDFQKEPTCES